MLWVLLVPGPSSVELALPRKSQQLKPWPDVCDPVQEGSGVGAEGGPRAYWALVVASTCITPEVKLHI